ncbi:hypothetical protein GCM10009117_15760 [Gangjinia marincola]|uniref:Uncharacterized protein n=2 Tax=Gangjinia marincola TaxID=578463 RepID=A0ABN1MH37_9FLAO
MKVFFVALLAVTLISCNNDDDTSPPPEIPDFSANLVGLWEFEEPLGVTDALYFGPNGELYSVVYGELGTTHLRTNDTYTYTYENNKVGGYTDVPFSYDGSNTIDIGTIDMGNVILNKVESGSSLFEQIIPLRLDNSVSTNITSFLGADQFNNLDGFEGELFVPNPSSEENRYLIFKKADLTFTESVTGLAENARSISIIDDVLPLRSIIETPNLTRNRLYQNTNPAFHPPALSDVFLDQTINAHTVTNENGYDFISYRGSIGNSKGTFLYHDVTVVNNLTATDEFAFYEAPLGTPIKGMDYVNGQNVLIFHESYNLHIFNIGFSSGDSVSTFEHVQSYTVIPQFREGEIKGAIQGVYFDENEGFLYLVISGPTDDHLVKMEFELPN